MNKKTWLHSIIGTFICWIIIGLIAWPYCEAAEKNLSVEWSFNGVTDAGFKLYNNTKTVMEVGPGDRIWSGKVELDEGPNVFTMTALLPNDGGESEPSTPFTYEYKTPPLVEYSAVFDLQWNSDKKHGDIDWVFNGSDTVTFRMYQNAVVLFDTEDAMARTWTGPLTMVNGKNIFEFKVVESDGTESAVLYSYTYEFMEIQASVHKIQFSLTIN